MKSDTLFRLSMSAAMLALVTVGCKPGATRPATIASSAPSAEREADRAAARAIAAIEARDGVRAVEQAEKAATLHPRDAAKRAILGQAYLLAGRFGSARVAFRDSLTLDPEQPRVALNLALTELATGSAPAAHRRLEALDGHAPAADLGLAFALAGEADRAIAILETAARDESATARTRQNLALGYALAGRWAEAHATAALDLPADRLNSRMLEWAMLVQPRTSWDRIAGVLGVKPHYDPGQPTALALLPDATPNPATPGAAPVAVATATPAPAAPALPVEADRPAPREEIAAVLAVAGPEAAPAPATAIARFDGAETTEFASAPAPAPAPQAEAKLLKASATVVERSVAPPPLIAAPQGPVKVAYVAPVRATPVARATVQQGRGAYVVQLGAYSAAARVESAWNRIAERVRVIENYTPSSSRFDLERVGTVYRLSLSGFETRGAAVSVCQAIKAKGGECFVRTVQDDRPVQWVSRKTRKPEQLAMR